MLLSLFIIRNGFLLATRCLEGAIRVCLFHPLLLPGRCVNCGEVIQQHLSRAAWLSLHHMNEVVFDVASPASTNLSRTLSLDGFASTRYPVHPSLAYLKDNQKTADDAACLACEEEFSFTDEKLDGIDFTMPTVEFLHERLLEYEPEHLMQFRIHHSATSSCHFLGNETNQTARSITSDGSSSCAREMGPLFLEMVEDNWPFEVLFSVPLVPAVPLLFPPDIVGTSLYKVFVYERNSATKRVVQGLATEIHLEVIPTREEFAWAQSFHNSTSLKHITETELEATSQELVEEISSIHVLNVIGGNFDGQKKMLASMWSHLKGDPLVHFSLLWVCDSSRLPTACDIHPAVQEFLTDCPGVNVIFLLPVVVKPSEFSARPSDGGISFLEFCGEETPSVELLYRYLVVRMRAADRNPELLSPPWVVFVWNHYLDLLGPLNIDVVVLGNTGDIADIVVPEAVLALGGRAVVLDIAASLARPPDLLSFDGIIGPSLYSLTAFQKIHEKANLRLFVSPPALNSTKYTELLRSQPLCSPQCGWHGDIAMDEMYRCGSSCLIVGFVGRLVTMKSPGLFLLAAAEIHRVVPTATFLVVGDGPLLNPLKSLASRLGLRGLVHFTGQASGADLIGYLRSMDLLVNPSLSGNETFCMVNIEAMAAGVPLVSFGSYGQAEYLNAGLPYSESAEFPVIPSHYHSITVDEPSVESLARGALHLIKNHSLRRRIGLRGQEFVSNRFTVEAAANRYKRALLHLLRA